MYIRGKSISPADIVHQRFGVSNLTKQEAASLCGVTLRTWSSWESGERRMPYSTWCWFVTITEGIPMNGDWHGWKFFNGKLWSPENAGFTPGEVRAIPILRQTLSAFKAADRQRQNPNAVQEVIDQRIFERGRISMAAEVLASLMADVEHSKDPMLRGFYQPVQESALAVTRLQFKLLDSLEVVR